MVHMLEDNFQESVLFMHHGDPETKPWLTGLAPLPAEPSCLGSRGCPSHFHGIVQSRHTAKIAQVSIAEAQSGNEV